MNQYGVIQYNTNEMVADYNSGNYTVSTIAKKQGISVGKAYNVLRDAGCDFTHKWRKKMSDEQRQLLSAVNKGKRLTEEQKKAISERNSCNYNGLNGYGHTKKHNHGYILAYAPKHPHAHKDGYVMLHTILMERAIGRYLAPDEVVHHINHNRDDNRLENLKLMNKKDHCTMHMIERHQKRRGLLSIA